MVEDFISEKEDIISKFGNYHLTEDRVIKLVENQGDRDYKDIQLDSIASFQHSKHFNKLLAIIGGSVTLLSLPALTEVPESRPLLGISLLGIITVVYAFATSDREYLLHSDAGTTMELPDSSNTKEFWKEINQVKNH